MLCWLGLHLWTAWMRSTDNEERVDRCVRCERTRSFVWVGGEGLWSGWVRK